MDKDKKKKREFTVFKFYASDPAGHGYNVTVFDTNEIDATAEAKEAITNLGDFYLKSVEEISE